MNRSHQTRDTILFVDDSRLMRFAARKSLSSHFDVVLADGGGAAIEALAANPAITAVVTDLMMPDTDGFDVIRHIRGADDARLRALPIMAVTGSTVEGDRLHALELGADDLMTKPFRPAMLHQRVAKLLADSPESAQAGLDARGVSQSSAERPIEVPAAPNVERSRVGFVERLRQAQALHLRHELPLTLLHLRLANAAAIEAELGATVLNALMRHLENDLVEAVRAEDTIGRTGRDHYTVLLPATPLTGARDVRGRIRGAIDDRVRQVRGRAVRSELVALIHVPKPDFDAGSLLAPRSGGDDDRRDDGLGNRFGNRSGRRDKGRLVPIRNSLG